MFKCVNTTVFRQNFNSTFLGKKSRTSNFGTGPIKRAQYVFWFKVAWESVNFIMMTQLKPFITLSYLCHGLGYKIMCVCDCCQCQLDISRVNLDNTHFCMTEGTLLKVRYLIDQLCLKQWSFVPNSDSIVSFNWLNLRIACP